MAKEKNNSHGNSSFWKIASDNYEEVQGWPEWKRSIVINSSTASTGKFIHSKAAHKNEK